MKKSIFLLCAMAISFSFLASSPVLAQVADQTQNRGMMGRRCISRWEMFRFMKNLDITAEQKDALMALKDETDNNTQALTTQIKDLQEQMTNTLLAADIDNATAESQIDAMLVLQTQIADILLHAELKAVRILTADQRALILEIVNKLRDCADAQHGWMGIKKPAYISLLMPGKSF